MKEVEKKIIRLEGLEKWSVAIPYLDHKIVRKMIFLKKCNLLIYKCINFYSELLGQRQRAS
jgi:hypothetical protein